MCWSFPRSICQNAKRDAIWKRGRPLIHKVPYTYPPFKVISRHNCTVFGVGGIQDWEGLQKCIHLHLYVCQYVCIEQELKNFIWSSWGEGVNEKFSTLVFRDFGGTKFGHKMKFVCCM